MPDFTKWLIDHLRLKPLPGEGGYYAETYRSEESTAIYYLLTPETFSALHRLQSDEVYHFYLGDPVEMVLLFPDGRSETVILGQDIESGMQVQFVVPKGVWQGLRLCNGGAYALMGTTMAPGFEFDRLEIGMRAELFQKYPGEEERIVALTRE